MACSRRISWASSYQIRIAHGARRAIWAMLACGLLAPLAQAQSDAESAVPTASRPVDAVTALPADAAPADSRWQASMAAFAEADRLKPPPPDGILFVGSSTIRLWSHLAEDFPDHPVVINRGFGGSTMADCQAFVQQLVLRYRPRQVLIYAGDNDLAQGRSPQQVRDSFVAFVNSVRADLPATRIDYLSIKPSPLRAQLLPAVRQTNALIAAYLRGVGNTGYIDIYTPMLDGAGQPRAELFGPDRLHMNDAGYRLWQQVVAGRLQDAVAGPKPAAPSVTGVIPAAAAGRP